MPTPTIRVATFEDRDVVRCPACSGEMTALEERVASLIHFRCEACRRSVYRPRQRQRQDRGFGAGKRVVPWV